MDECEREFKNLSNGNDLRALEAGRSTGMTLGDPSIIHHLSVGTNDIVSARRFYDAVMPVLGMRLLNGSAGSTDYGATSFLISVETPVDGRSTTPGNGVHVALAAGRRAMVEQNSIRRPWPMEGGTLARPACAPSTTPMIMALSSSIPMATKSKQIPIPASETY